MKELLYIEYFQQSSHKQFFMYLIDFECCRMQNFSAVVFLYPLSFMFFRRHEHFFEKNMAYNE
jgi:hypothetical protein